MRPTPARPIRLYRAPLSGHAHRVQLFLALLALPTELVEVDLRNGEQKTEAFLRLNPFGQVPVIDDDGTVVADSNAILVYLAKRYGEGRWLPEDPLGAARVQRWLSVAAGEIAHGPALARLIAVFGAPYEPALPTRRAHHLFHVMEQTLVAQPYLAGETPTIADVAAYTYIAHAPEGGVSLDDYAKLRTWLARVEALPGFVAMARPPAR